MVVLKNIAVLVGLVSLTGCNPIDGASGDVVPQLALGNIAVPFTPVQIDRSSSAESPSRAAKKVSWDSELEKKYEQTQNQEKQRYPSPPPPVQPESQFLPKTPKNQEGKVSRGEGQYLTGEMAKPKLAVREVLERGFNSLAERNPQANGFVRTLNNIFGALNKRQDPAAATPGMPDSSPTGMDTGNQASVPVAGPAGAPAVAPDTSSGPPDPAGGAAAGGPPPGPGNPNPADGPASNSPSSAALGSPPPTAAAANSPQPPASDAGVAAGLGSPAAPAAGALGPLPSPLAPGPDAANKPPAVVAAPGQPGTPSPSDGLSPQAGGIGGSSKPQNGARPNGSHHHQHNARPSGKHHQNHNSKNQGGHHHHRNGPKKEQHHHQPGQNKGHHRDSQAQNSGANQSRPTRHPTDSQPNGALADNSAANSRPAGAPPGSGVAQPQDPVQPPQQPVNIPPPSNPAPQPPIGAPFMGLGGVHLPPAPPPMIMPLIPRDDSRRTYTRHISGDNIRKRKTSRGVYNRKRSPVQTRHQSSNTGASTPGQGFGAMTQPIDASFGYKAAGAAAGNGVEASTLPYPFAPEPRLTRSKATVKSSVSSGDVQMAANKVKKVNSIDTLKWGGKKAGRKHKKPRVNENHSSRFEIDHEMVKMNRRSAEDRAYLRAREAYVQDNWVKDQFAKRDAYAVPEPFAYAEPQPFAYAEPEPYPYATADPEACPNPYACPDSYRWTQ